MSVPDSLLDEPEGDVETDEHDPLDCPAPGRCVPCREFWCDVDADHRVDAARGN